MKRILMVLTLAGLYSLYGAGRYYALHGLGVVDRNYYA